MPKVWLITGSARGLGRALAEAVLAAGQNLVATARNPAQLADLAQRYGDRVRAVALDVTNEQAAADAVAVARKAFGRLDVLANNAGYGNVSPIEDTNLEEFRAQIETNLFGVINVTKAALPWMREQRSGHILQFSSVGGRIGPVGRAPYAAAKWAPKVSPKCSQRKSVHSGHRIGWFSHRLRRLFNGAARRASRVRGHRGKGSPLPARL